jgi:hypothetical protein
MDLHKCLIIIGGHTRAKLTARIAQTRIQLERAVVAEEPGRTIAHVHVGQRLTAYARGSVLARIGRAIVNRHLTENARVTDQTGAHKSVEHALASTVVSTRRRGAKVNRRLTSFKVKKH